MTVRTSDWDACDYLGTDEDVSEYLNAAMEEGNSALLQAALGDVAKARGMGDVARASRVGRESLYKSLSADGNPSFQTVVKVLASLGVRMRFSPMNSSRAGQTSTAPQV